MSMTQRDRDELQLQSSSMVGLLLHLVMGGDQPPPMAVAAQMQQLARALERAKRAFEANGAEDPALVEGHTRPSKFINDPGFPLIVLVIGGPVMADPARILLDDIDVGYGNGELADAKLDLCDELLFAEDTPSDNFLPFIVKAQALGKRISFVRQKAGAEWLVSKKDKLDELKARHEARERLVSL